MKNEDASMAAKVSKIISSLLEENVLISDDYDRHISEYGIDSITFIWLVIKLEDEFNITVADEYLILSRMNTVNQICQILKKCSQVK